MSPKPTLGLGILPSLGIGARVVRGTKCSIYKQLPFFFFLFFYSKRLTFFVVVIVVVVVVVFMFFMFFFNNFINDRYQVLLNPKM